MSVSLASSTRVTLLSTVAGLLLLAGAARAQETSDPQATGDEVRLDTITVQAAGSATEGTGAWTSQGPTGTATGLSLSPRETPQSISIVTQEQIRDANAVTLTDAVRMTTGLTAAQGNGEIRYSYFARGHEITNVQYDGLATRVHWYSRDANPADDLAMYDRLEVVRGATGLMEGTGEPSASLNLVRKHALPERQTTADVSLTSFGRFGTTLDHSTPLNAAGTVRGRIVANGYTGDSYRDGSSEDYGLLYGTLDADLGERTSASVGISYARQNIDGYSWGGLPTRIDGSFFPEFDARTSPSLPWEHSYREETVGFAEVEHRLDNGWTLRAAGRAAASDTDMLSSYLDYDPDGNLTRGGGQFDYTAHNYALDARATGPVTLFGRRHEIVFGASGNQDETSYVTPSAYSYIVPDPLDLQSPDIGPSPRDFASFSTDTQTQWGIYGVGRFSLTDAMTLIAGARVAWYESENESDYGNSSYSADGELVPYVGAVYDISDTWTAYASYSEIFSPLSETGLDGGILKPVTGSNLEAGLKAGFLGGALEATAAIFQSDETGLPEQLPNGLCPVPGVSCYEAAGKIRTRGVELDVTGNVTDRWKVMAGYTYADPKYVEGDNDGEPYRTDYYPRHIAKLATTYDLAGSLQGLTVGASMQAQSGLHYDDSFWFDDTMTFSIRQGGYAIFNLMARYEVTEATSVQVNVDNLFDRDYYSAIGAPGYGNFMGQGLTATVGLRHTF